MYDIVIDDDTPPEALDAPIWLYPAADIEERLRTAPEGPAHACSDFATTGLDDASDGAGASA
jgi:hypothetical protein